MNIAIIGGGLTGLTAAYELLKYGHQVTVFEKEKTLGGLAGGFKPASRRGADASSPRVEAGRSGLNKELIEQLSFEVQEAITDVLVAKTMKAAELYHAKSILISGGVASNEQLRNKFILTMEQCNNVTIVMPPASLCTDNAAFIGSYAYFRGVQEDWHTITAIPDLPVEE